MRVASSNYFFHDFFICSRVSRCYSISPKFVVFFFAINKDGLRAVGIPARMAENSAGADFKLFEAPSLNQTSTHQKMQVPLPSILGRPIPIASYQR